MMEMSEYERARLARMERNEKVLRDLGLNKSKIDMTSSTKKKKKASSRGLTGRKRKKASPLPRRKSRRVQGLPSDGVYIEAVLPGGKPVLSKGDTTVRKSTPKASETLAPRKRYEHPRKDLNSRELDSKPLTSSSTFEMSTAVNYLSSLPKSEKKKTKKKMSSSLNDLELEESSIAKMTPDRIYSVAVRPCSSSFVIAAGDKSGHLGLWNFSSQSSTENDGVSCWRPCNAVINTLHWMDSDRLLLTSYDGTIRIADFSAQRLNFVYGLDEDDSSWIQYSTYCDLSKCLYVAKSDGNVVALDVRSRTKKIWDHELHDKKVQTVSCSPVSSHYMVTASLDRSVRLWDIRKIGKKKGKPVWTYHDSRSVNSASFDGKDGSSIVTVSQSNFVRLFSDPTSSLSGDHVAPTCSVRHNNNTGRYLTVFHACWKPNSSDTFVMGSMTQPRRVDIFSVSGNVMTRSGDLDSPGLLNSVQSRFAFHPDGNALCCGNSSGRMHVFT